MMTINQLNARPKFRLNVTDDDDDDRAVLWSKSSTYWFKRRANGENIATTSGTAAPSTYTHERTRTV